MENNKPSNGLLGELFQMHRKQIIEEQSNVEVGPFVFGSLCTEGAGLVMGGMIVNRQ